MKRLKEAMFANEPRHSAMFAINGLEIKTLERVFSQNLSLKPNRP